LAGYAAPPLRTAGTWVGFGFRRDRASASLAWPMCPRIANTVAAARLKTGSNPGQEVVWRSMMRIQKFDIITIKCHHLFMRTTLSLDDDIMALVTRQAKLRGVSLGKTVSELVRRGLNAPTPSAQVHGLVVFQLPPDSPKVTTEDVRRIEAEGI
jgi:hypothetical protein